MGQLEKYGLYVLCLVIFLILGVTIWGGDTAAGPRQQNPAVSMRADPLDGVGARNGTAVAQRNASAKRAGGEVAGGDYIDSLLSPVTPPPVTGRQGNKGTETRKGPSGPNASGPGKPQGDAGNGAQGNGNGNAAPVPTPTPAPAPAPQQLEYEIRRGDILGEIASRQLGSTRYVPAILELNPGLDPKRLQIGMKIKLPPRDGGPRSQAAGPAATDGALRDYTIGKGDTYERIARTELGSRSRIAEIQALNPGVDPTRLQIGRTIKLPRK